MSSAQAGPSAPRKVSYIARIKAPTTATHRSETSISRIGRGYSNSNGVQLKEEIKGDIEVSMPHAQASASDNDQAWTGMIQAIKSAQATLNDHATEWKDAVGPDDVPGADLNENMSARHKHVARDDADDNDGADDPSDDE